jgi:hypothetical protein
MFPRSLSALAGLLLAVLSSPTLLSARENAPLPDLTTGGTKDDSHDWNLGPTGARGWIWANKMETSDARQILITQVEHGSPADGVLAVEDVILGVDGKPFASDARRAFGEAIGVAERTENRGALRLLRWRKGKTEQVVVPLKPLGSYSATAPYDCPKSSRIFAQGCEAIAARLKTAKDKERGNPIVRSLNALALLASGRPEYLPLIREEAHWAAGYVVTGGGYESWLYGYVNLFLAEYELATHDPEVMPGLQRITLAIAHGQSSVGSWGHHFSYPNGLLEGYGAMHQPGLPLMMSLVLARAAGVKDPALDLAITRGDRFINFYIGKGCIPYGDHHPWMETHDDNGKCAAGAVLFDLLGNAQGTEFFSRMTTASYGGERDTGHTGNFFNILWALPGVSRSGPQATGAWMQEFAWYYDLARSWDGTFGYQGEPGIPRSASDHQYRDFDCTGAYLLAYALPLKSLYLTGRKPSVAPQLTAQAARGLIEDGRGWSPAQKAYGYAPRTVEQLFAGLASWSPIVRERSGQELARRQGDFVPRLLTLLDGKDPGARLGACQALAALGKRAAPAVPALRQTLWGDDLWLRIKAADALSNIGDAAHSAVPDLLKVIATPGTNDPRGMVQRYVAFCLFYPGTVLNERGLVSHSLAGVDRRLLYPAVEAVLQNQDGRARGTIGTVYDQLTFEEVRPLLPAVYRAVVEPPPSGEMFADGIRVRGLELLAKYRISEGVPLCVTLCEPGRWGAGKRIGPCLKALETYGAAAKPELPELHKLEAILSKPKADAHELLPAVRHAIASIESATDTTPLQSLDQLAKPTK